MKTHVTISVESLWSQRDFFTVQMFFNYSTFLKKEIVNGGERGSSAVIEGSGTMDSFPLLQTFFC